jgi:hypothetical protein
MRLALPRLRRLRRDERGSTIVEFAMLLTPLITLLMGGIEAGYFAYSKAVMEGTLRTAARMATTGAYTGDEIDEYVRENLEQIGVDGDDVEIDKRSYGSFAQVNKPEPLTSDVAPIGGTPGAGDCYIDLNGDGSWSEDAGADGLGESEDIIYYQVTVSYPLLFKFMSPAFGADDGRLSLTANTTVKNEPFGDAREPPVTRCIV